MHVSTRTFHSAIRLGLGRLLLLSAVSLLATGAADASDKVDFPCRQIWTADAQRILGARAEPVDMGPRTASSRSATNSQSAYSQTRASNFSPGWRKLARIQRPARLRSCRSEMRATWSTTTRLHVHLPERQHDVPCARYKPHQEHPPYNAWHSPKRSPARQAAPQTRLSRRHPGISPLLPEPRRPLGRATPGVASVPSGATSAPGRVCRSSRHHEAAGLPSMPTLSTTLRSMGTWPCWTRLVESH